VLLILTLFTTYNYNGKLNVFNPLCISVFSFGNQLNIITLLCMSTAMIRISIGTCISLVSVKCLYARFVVLNATFNNISVISWAVSFIGWGNRSTRENHRHVVCHCLTLKSLYFDTKILSKYIPSLQKRL
jgi:hypothetical protein